MTDLTEMIHAMADARLDAADRMASATRDQQSVGVLQLHPAVRPTPARIPDAERIRKSLRLLG